MAFVNVEELSRMELFPKAMSRLVAGERLMLSFLDLEEGCVVPEHSHPHEQAGVVLEGRFQFRIGTEEHITGPGDAFVVPANVVHAGKAIDGPVKILDIFNPPRQDYLEKYNKYTDTSTKTVWTEKG